MFFSLDVAMALSCQLRSAGVVPRLGRVKGIAVLVALLALVAASAGEAKRQPVTVRVLTRNLYLGANLDPILQAKSFHEAFLAVEADWAQVQANDFPTRARAIAREIAQTRPDFVGFQELTLYRTQTPADLTVTPATTVALDYAAELRKALAARKLALPLPRNRQRYRCGAAERRSAERWTSG